MATLYTDYKNGNDAADGSTGSPLKTITHALMSHANDGDTILVRGSSAADEIYYEVIVSAMAKNNITVQPDTGHKPVVTSGFNVTGWSLTGGQSFTYEAAEPSSMYGGCYNGTEYLTTTTSVALVEATESSCYWDNAGNKLYVHIAGGGEPTSIAATSTGKVFLFSGTGNTIRGLTFQWVGNTAVSFTGASNTVDGCTFRLFGTWSPSAILISTANCVVSKCVSTLIWLDKETGNAVNGTATSSNLLIEQCTFTGGGVPILFQGGTGHLVRDTICQNSAQQSVFFKADGAGTLSRCVFKNAAYGTIRGHSAHTGTVTIEHCLIYFGPDTFPSGVHMKTGLHVHGLSSTWNMYHNTFANLRTGDGYAFYVQPDVAPGTITIRAKNNLFYNCIRAINYDTNWAQVVSDLSNNAFYLCDTDFRNVPVGDQGSGNVMANPLLANPGASPWFDPRLLPHSPCIDAGTAVAGITEGFRGGAPDIGAHEYVRPRRRR